MYRNDTPTDRKTMPGFNSPVLARFESWLKSHGFQTGRDPFFPAESCSETLVSAASLMTEYLEDRPNERPHRQILMKHARDLGDVAPIWGDNSCGYESLFGRPEEMTLQVPTGW